MAYSRIVDTSGRLVKPLILNESEDGTGTSHMAVCDSNGYLKVNLQTVGDDVVWSLGTDSDIAFVLRSSVLNADTALTGVLVGTPDTSALAANSLIISNITTDGDILIAGSDGGHSKQAIFFDSSTGILHLGKPGTPGNVSTTGDVYAAGSLEVDTNAYFAGSTYIQGSLYANDDKTIYLGTSADGFLIYETADANAKLLMMGLPHVDEDANNVAVLALVDRDKLAADLGAGGIDLSGKTEPTLVIGNEASNAWVSLDAGDSVGGAGKGLYFHPAADEDVDLINLSNTDTPRFYWNETTSKFHSTVGLTLDAGFSCTNIDITGYIYMDDGDIFAQGTYTDQAIKHKTDDADACCMAAYVRTGTGNYANNVPVFTWCHYDGRGADWGLFNGITQPLVVTLDADSDSYFGITFNADDVAELVAGGAGSSIIINPTTLGFFGQTPAAQQTYPGAALEQAYEAGELDSEAEVITAINATNTMVNLLRSAVVNLGLTAAS